MLGDNSHLYLDCGCGCEVRFGKGQCFDEPRVGIAGVGCRFQLRKLLLAHQVYDVSIQR